MNKQFAWSESADDPFPFPYGSDLHELWGWGQRLYDCYSKDQKQPGVCDAGIFRPHRGAWNALMRLGREHPLIVKQIDDFRDHVEKCWTALSEDGYQPDTPSAITFLEAIESLTDRIRVAIQTITQATEFADRPDTKTDTEKNSRPGLPENPDVLKLAKRIKQELPKGGTKADIARDFAGGNEKHAQSLLRKLRSFPDLLQ